LAVHRRQVEKAYPSVLGHRLQVWRETIAGEYGERGVAGAPALGWPKFD
jgi:hypothetical protein